MEVQGLMKTRSRFERRRLVSTKIIHESELYETLSNRNIIE
jgi:hypothetical protein